MFCMRSRYRFSKRLASHLPEDALMVGVHDDAFISGVLSAYENLTCASFVLVKLDPIDLRVGSQHDRCRKFENERGTVLAAQVTFGHHQRFSQVSRLIPDVTGPTTTGKWGTRWIDMGLRCTLSC